MGYNILKQGGSAVDAVEGAVTVLKTIPTSTQVNVRSRLVTSAYTGFSFPRQINRTFLKCRWISYLIC